MKNHFDLAAALLNPCSVFRDPEKVLKAENLTDEDKLSILNLWAHDAQLLQVCDEENMCGGPTKTLRRINICIRDLKSEMKKSVHYTNQD